VLLPELWTQGVYLVGLEMRLPRLLLVEFHFVVFAALLFGVEVEVEVEFWAVLEMWVVGKLIPISHWDHAEVGRSIRINPFGRMNTICLVRLTVGVEGSSLSSMSCRSILAHAYSRFRYCKANRGEDWTMEETPETPKISRDPRTLYAISSRGTA